MSKSPVRVGLIGLGNMGRNHLRVLSMLNSISLEFVYDLDPAAARAAAAAYGARVSEDLDSVLSGVDAVVICTPTVTHADYIRKASQFVRHIFVEKPVADTVARAQEVQQLVEQAGIRLQVGFIERFNPAVQGLRKILGRSPQVLSIDFTRTNKLSARITDVDVVTDLMIHDIDLALYMNGPVSAVSAHGVHREGMIDFASALLTHDNGRFSRIQASRVTEKKIRSIRATCLDLYVDCDLLRKEIVINRQSEIRQLEGEPYTVTAVEETVAVAPQEALLLELQAFAANCRGEVSAVPEAAEGVAAMDICEQIRGTILP